MFPVLVSVYRLGTTKLSNGQIFRDRAEEGFVCIAEVRVAMVEMRSAYDCNAYNAVGI